MNTAATVFLIHYGELGLKGRNRKDFELQLKRNILEKTRRQGIEVKLEYKHKYFELSPYDAEALPRILNETFGIAWFAKARKLPAYSMLSSISDAVLEEAAPKSSEKKTFRVTAKRADKEFPIKSPEIERKIGERIILKTMYETVNLKDPDDEYFVEIDRDATYIFCEKLPGPGGLPVGTGGKVLTLFSGGIDSPVAAYMMAKRGCRVDYLHFYAQKPTRKSKIQRLIRRLSGYTGPARLYLAPYLHFNLAVSDLETHYELVLFRRFMMKLAEELCRKHQYQAIVTGDNLGQVASQTIENISASDSATAMLCLRPLIGLDKQEIIDIAKEIGTLEISNEPMKDCCSLIDRHAKTKVSGKKIQTEESKIENYPDLLEKTLAETDIIDNI